MKTAIIVHSLTGNTLSVAERLKENLEKAGQEVHVERLEPMGGENSNEMDPSKIRFQHRMKLAGYDNIVIAGPVRGFSMSPVLKAYLAEVDDLQEQRVFLFVTHFFPFHFMGGTSAIRQMKRFIEERGGAVEKSKIIDWKNPSREKRIENLITEFTKEIN